MKRHAKRSMAKAVLGVSLLCAGSTVVYGQAMGTKYGFEAIIDVAKDLSELTANFYATLTGFSTSFATQLSYSYERTIELIKVATAQEAASAWDITDAIVKSGQTLAAAVQQQELADDIVLAAADVHPETGQGYNSCSTLDRVKTMDLSFDVATRQAQQGVQEAEHGPGRMVQSRIAVMKNRVRNHLENFCSSAEAEAGLCKLSDEPGGDVNAALLFDAADPDSLKASARKAYIAHVMGTPDEKVSRAAGSSAAGEQFFMDKNRKDSLMSVPAYSLAVIDESNTRRPEFNDLSANELMKKRVDQYFGGEEAAAWSSSMAKQRMRGLLVEANRLASLENWMLHKVYQRTQRMEANLAALAIATVEMNRAHSEGNGERTRVGARMNEVAR